MARVWLYFFVMFWIVSILSSGIYLFARGFLLSRRIRTEFTECIKLNPCSTDDSDDLNCLSRRKVDEMFTNINSTSDYCLPRKTRIILIVIDALKYEFGLFNEHKRTLLPYENNLPVFKRLLVQEPQHSRFMKLVADAPTTTLQRLKGITTGSLPTFIDIGSNFATAEINEDNIIDQIKRSNMSTVFMGDSTWSDLYPKRFNREYSYPSFDIFDLDTVDTAINRHLPMEIARDDWSLLVAHYLGVDHCGHRYGPMHAEMTRKLKEMNEAIEKVIGQMDDETTLLVIGDHGMTSTGDHGGDSQDEVNSLLFAYTKKYTFMTNSGNDTMEQIDMPSTLAAILGTPMPFSNLGVINFDIVPDVVVPYMTKLQTQIMHTWQNTNQMYSYFRSYSSTENANEIPIDLLNSYLKQFEIFSLRVSSLYKENGIESFCQEVRGYLKDIAADCRKIWAQFDDVLIQQGLMIVAVTIIFLFLLTTNLKFNHFGLIFTAKNMSTAYGTNIALIIGAPIVHYLMKWDVSILDILFYTSVYGIGLFSFLLMQNWELITMNLSQHQHFTNLFTRSIFLVASCVFFSNSYIINEQKVLCFLVCGALAVFLYKVRKEYVWMARVRKLRPEMIFHSSFFKLAAFTIAAIVLLRASYTYHRCREEHGDCNEFKIESVNSDPLKNIPFKIKHTNWYDLLPIVVMAFFTVVSRGFLKKCGNLCGFSPAVVIARYGPVVSAVACSLHFIATLGNLSKTKKHNNLIGNDILAWVVYIVFALELMILTVRPLMLFILHRPNRTFNLSPFGCVVPQIVMKMKQMYDGIANGNVECPNDDIPTVYGLATVYSSVMVSFIMTLVFVITLVVGPLAANGVFIVLFAATLILVMNAIHRYQRCTRLAFCLQPEVIAVVAWHLLGQYSFYATSHQPTLSQIDWHAAFVGRSAHYDHNNFLSATLVILNTFGGHILIFILFPLLIIAPTALYAIFPSLAPRRTAKLVIQNQDGTKQREIVKTISSDVNAIGEKSDDAINVMTFAGLDSENEHLDITRGELALYENDDLFFGQLFKTGTQLITLQAIRIFCSMMASTIHCRHLMVWKIFAPRFIFEAIATFITFGAILLGLLVIIRTHKAVSNLISKMSDANK